MNRYAKWTDGTTEDISGGYMAESRCCSAGLRDRWAQAEKKGEQSQILRGGQSVDTSEEGSTEHLSVVLSRKGPPAAPAAAPGYGQSCCLIEDGERCVRPAGNASFSKRVQKSISQKKLKLDIDKSLQVNTLRRYKRHYKLQTRPGFNKAQLAETVSRHFRNIPVNEKETLAYFIYMVKSNKSRLDQKAEGGKQLE
ncbi:histone deacetylase complex subunit SAP30L-like [Lutra lutra]|uniref:histone deacetylase complex subunit SAP30L-like n=1 Tax=Lutra lutra TaxID=9657 RepID=UPI001FD0B25B|nr:histone deacetylase complex subunit SAP30L-like [Lutra lutra]